MSTHKEWYLKNKEKRKKAIRDRQKRQLKEVQDLKLQMGCKICGYNKTARALTFHHINDDKEGNVARLCTQGRSMKFILEEISKCICVCMNCHMEIHDELDQLVPSSTS